VLLFEGSPFYIGMAVILLSMLILKVARKKRYPFLLFYFVFCVYVLHVLKYTLFPIPVDPRVIAIHAEPTIDFSKGINLIPFSNSSMRNGFDREMLLNVLLTIPFGFGIPFLTRIHLKKLVLVGLTMGVTIELLQLFLSLMLGFPYRYVDINDVIHNFTGVLVNDSPLHDSFIEQLPFYPCFREYTIYLFFLLRTLQLRKKTERKIDLRNRPSLLR
jgi:glycopeptide antibiotics resistance protein